jgi:phage-related protein
MRAAYSASTWGMHHISLRHGFKSFSARSRRTVWRERLSCSVSSTSASANNVQRARPCGGFEQAVATGRASSCPTACARLRHVALRSARLQDLLPRTGAYSAIRWRRPPQLFWRCPRRRSLDRAASNICALLRLGPDACRRSPAPSVHRVQPGLTPRGSKSHLGLLVIRDPVESIYDMDSSPLDPVSSPNRASTWPLSTPIRASSDGLLPKRICSTTSASAHQQFIRCYLLSNAKVSSGEPEGPRAASKF